MTTLTMDNVNGDNKIRELSFKKKKLVYNSLSTGAAEVSYKKDIVNLYIYIYYI